MPLVFTSNEVTASGHAYEDITGVSYEYPKAYRMLVRQGERFVYYRRERTAKGGRQTPVYFGAGIVGAIRVSRRDPNRLVCEILDYRPFSSPLPFRGADEQPLEPGGMMGGIYYRRGVRSITESVFEAILRMVDASEPSDETQPVISHETRRVYASPGVARAVEDFAMRVATEHLRGHFPGVEVVPQPHNNPGYDIRVGPPASPCRYVEVKGSQR